MQVSRDMMRETTRDFTVYYNPKLHGEVRLDTNTNVLGSNPAAEKYLRESSWDLNGYPNTYVYTNCKSYTNSYNFADTEC